MTSVGRRGISYAAIKTNIVYLSASPSIVINLNVFAIHFFIQISIIVYSQFSISPLERSTLMQASGGGVFYPKLTHPVPILSCHPSQEGILCSPHCCNKNQTFRHPFLSPFGGSTAHDTQGAGREDFSLLVFHYSLANGALL